mgnify:CR=1 FL=1
MFSLTLDFLNAFVTSTESNWENVVINPKIFGFQFQKGTHWRKGLTDLEISKFENDLGVSFPNEYKFLLRNINGTDLPTMNINGAWGNSVEYSIGVYSYPDDINTIRKAKSFLDVHSEEWGFDTQENDYFIPFYSHRYIQVRNEEIQRVVSVYGNDGIEYGKDMRSYLEKEFIRFG